MTGLGARGSRFDLRADLDDADSAMLAANAERAPAQGQQHGVRRHRGVTHEGGFLARIEETQPHIVIRRVRGEHECHLGVGEFTRDGKQGGVILSVRIEDHDRGISREAGRGEGVYLKNAQCNLQNRWRSFARIGPAGYTCLNLGVA